MIKSLLIANRGEIACRIIRTNFLCVFVSSRETFNVSVRGECGNFLTRRHEDTKKRDLRA